MILEADSVVTSEFNVLECSLHYATYIASIGSSSDRSVITNFTVRASDSRVPPSKGETTIQANASDHGHLALLSSLNKVLTGYIRIYPTNDVMNRGSDLPKTTLMFT